jgi:N-acetylglucosamine-6-phosphate deacetylase
VLVVDGRIAAVGPELVAPAGTPVLAVAEGVVVPGFIDLQINGAHGIDLAREPERLGELAALLPRHGVTAFCPTIVSSPPGVVERALAATPSGICGRRRRRRSTGGRRRPASPSSPSPPNCRAPSR